MTQLEVYDYQNICIDDFFYKFMIPTSLTSGQMYSMNFALSTAHSDLRIGPAIDPQSKILGLQDEIFHVALYEKSTPKRIKSLPPNPMNLRQALGILEKSL